VPKPVAGSFWYGAWRPASTCQAIGTAGRVPAPRGAWRQGVLRQAAPVKQWVWRTLAPGGGKVPPSGLGLFRLAVLDVASGENQAVYDLCTWLLSDDAWIGRCCAMSG